MEMSCGCLPSVPDFDVPPPPDPSLIWHLLSDEPFQKAPDCEWGPFVSLNDVSSSGNFPLSSKALILVAIATVCLFLILVCTLFHKLRRRRGAGKTKTVSSDAILACGDNVWTYNSMKTTNSGADMYGCGSNPNVNRMFSHATPGTVRSYVTCAPEPVPLRHSASTTLRLHPRENMAAYHTVAPPTEHYEEIPVRGTLPPYFHLPPPPTTPPGVCAVGRMSMRKPPPTCRPPPPPRQEFSPAASDGSLERELQGIPADSPPFRKWDEEGRESGYGTAPSRQWRGSPGSNGKQEDGRPNGFQLSQHPSQSMTYV